jgi:hypothetical protein
MCFVVIYVAVYKHPVGLPMQVFVPYDPTKPAPKPVKIRTPDAGTSFREYGCHQLTLITYGLFTERDVGYEERKAHSQDIMLCHTQQDVVYIITHYDHVAISQRK